MAYQWCVCICLSAWCEYASPYQFCIHAAYGVVDSALASACTCMGDVRAAVRGGVLGRRRNTTHHRSHDAVVAMQDCCSHFACMHHVRITGVVHLCLCVWFTSPTSCDVFWGSTRRRITTQPYCHLPCSMPSTHATHSFPRRHFTHIPNVYTDYCAGFK